MGWILLGTLYITCTSFHNFRLWDEFGYSVALVFINVNNLVSVFVLVGIYTLPFYGTSNVGCFPILLSRPGCITVFELLAFIAMPFYHSGWNLMINGQDY